MPIGLRLPKLRAPCFGKGNLENCCKAIAILQLIFLINGLLIATDEVHNEEIFNDYNITGAHNLNNQYKIQSSSGRYDRFRGYGEVRGRQTVWVTAAFSLGTFIHINIDVFITAGIISSITTTVFLLFGIQKRNTIWIEPFIVTKAVTIINDLFDLGFGIVARVWGIKAIFIFYQLAKLGFECYVFTVVFSYHEDLQDQRRIPSRCDENEEE